MEEYELKWIDCLKGQLNFHTRWPSPCLYWKPIINCVTHTVVFLCMHSFRMPLGHKQLIWIYSATQLAHLPLALLVTITVLKTEQCFSGGGKSNTNLKKGKGTYAQYPSFFNMVAISCNNASAFFCFFGYGLVHSWYLCKLPVKSVNSPSTPISLSQYSYST